jgi:hypothetical protein
MQSLHAAIFIEMQSNFAVGPRAQPMSGMFQLPLDRFIPIEFAIDDDPDFLVLVRNRLISGGEVDDAEPGVPQRNPAVGRNPVALAIGTAVIQALRRAWQNLGRNGSRREKSATIPHMGKYSGL